MTESKPIKERRKHVRLKKNLPVEVAFRFMQEDGSESSPQEASILNISASGVCIEMDDFNEAWKEDLLFGRILIVLKIILPDKEEGINVMARAVWSTKTKATILSSDSTAKYLIGARFVKISPKEEEAILHYIIKYFI